MNNKNPISKPTNDAEMRPVVIDAEGLVEFYKTYRGAWRLIKPGDAMGMLDWNDNAYVLIEQDGHGWRVPVSIVKFK